MRSRYILLWPFRGDALCFIRQIDNECIRDAAENDAAAQRIASTADDFARQFLTRSARLKYWQAALERYAALFKDYDASLNMTEIFA